MRPYHPANFKFQPFPVWRVACLAWAAKALGIQFKIEGIPFGSRRLKNRINSPKCGTGKAIADTAGELKQFAGCFGVR